MDGRGQISVEYILFVGFVLVVILVIANVVGDQSEQNAIATSAKLGAVNATTEIGILNTTVQPLRVNEIVITGSDPIDMTIYLSGTTTSSQKVDILTSVNRSIAAEGYSPQYTGSNVVTLSTSRRDYNIILA